ncbi:MAG: hypothetical protein ACU0A9_15900 [Alterinioella nitratireducens]|jgi:hypothetical protein|uniref:hypothetical protein n=1 Tax=Alterinioella nitratireducens TaxID=2735915 RepID=UPI004058C1A1|tara:strand:- start:297 stop:584 length:288 start_codon:yes stop_codon:yes gene_type:complete
MTTSSEYTTLFDAYREARLAYERLSAKGLSRPDRDLARDPDYRRFLRSGVTMARIGGPVAIEGAIASLDRSADEPYGSEQADLARLWAGVGVWTN